MLKDSNPKIKAIHALLEHKDITGFAQVFKKKHFSAADLALIIGRSEAYLRKCIDNPANFSVGDLAKIAGALDITRKQLVTLVLEDFDKKPAIKKPQVDTKGRSSKH